MKKFILILTACGVSAVYAQKTKMSYRVGVVTSLPANVTNTSINAGSTMLEASRKISKKLSVVGNTGYIRITSDATISQIPVLAGLKYGVTEQWYFGAAAGLTIPTKKGYGDTQFGYSPYLGYQKGHISVDARYYLSGTQTPLSTMALVFSYSL
jgi:hypothetical protein